MNTIEKIISESKTQKAAVIKIMDLANRVSGRYGETEVAKMVKDISSGRLTVFASRLAQDILADERIWKLDQDREWLALNPPLLEIEKAIKTLDEKLAEWFDKAKTNPFYELSWGGCAFEWAAKRKAYLEIKNSMNRITKNGIEPDNLTAEKWEAILAEIRKETLRMARGNSRSTSQVSNLADDCLMAAKAGIAGDDDWTTAAISYWFNKKVKFDEEVASMNRNAPIFV